MSYDGDVAWDIVENCLFLIDAEDESTVLAEYTNSAGKPCCENIRSQQFKTYLRQEYRRRTEEIDAPSFKMELQAKLDEAFEDPNFRVKFYHRVAGSIRRGVVYYAIGDGTRRAIKVKSEKWAALNSVKVRFIQSAASNAQVTPARGERNLLDLLRPYYNLVPDTFLLFVVWLVHAFSRDSDHFVCIVSGPKGTGKSTMTDITRSLIDPSKINKNLTPKSLDDLVVNLSKNYVISIDNSKPLTREMSDVMCAAVTGAAASKRKLYTDTDEVIMKLHNVVILNGIDIIPKQSDLVDRALLFETTKIETAERKPESELIEDFNKQKRRIMGAIFDTLATAIQKYPEVKPGKLHRMADAHREMIAIALALGIEQAEFERILDDNIEAIQKAYAGSNEFVDFLVDYVLLNGKQEGPASKVYERIYRHITGNKRFMPGSASAFSRRLTNEKDALNNSGIRFDKYKKGDANYLKIERIPQSQQTKAQKKAVQRLLSTEDEELE